MVYKNHNYLILLSILSGGTEFANQQISLLKEVNAMKCHRCGGVMTYEKFYGNAEDFFGWRCILCGEIVDPVILENRHVRKDR